MSDRLLYVALVLSVFGLALLAVAAAVVEPPRVLVGDVDSGLLERRVHVGGVVSGVHVFKGGSMMLELSEGGSRIDVYLPYSVSSGLNQSDIEGAKADVFGVVQLYNGRLEVAVGRRCVEAAMIVNASDLGRYEFCPRAIYLTGFLGASSKPTLQQVSGLVGHYVRKELSFRQSRVLGKVRSPSELGALLRSELDTIVSDVPFIYRERWSCECDGLLPIVKAEVSRELVVLEEKLRFLVDDLGFDGSLKLLTPWKVEYDVKSDTIGLSGRVDKILREDGITPVELKTGQPSDGVWEGDRMQLCAYCMQLEEKFGEAIPFGFVEYTRIQERRPVIAAEKLRRKVIHTRDKVADILSGKVPDVCPHGSGRKCESCGLKDECYRT